jgi:hypothetical protein
MSEEYKYNCEKCNYHSNSKHNFYRHKKSKKHLKNYKDEIELENIDNKEKKYHCEWCKYYTNSKSCFSHHKRTKKHKKKMEELEEKYNYHCQKCDYKTNDDTAFINHYQDNHIDLEKNYKQYYNNQQNITNNNTNSNNNNTINNTYHFHLNNDSETFKLMLNSLDHQKFTKMIGLTNNINEFNKLELWDKERISNNVITSIVDKSIENKSISNIKMTDTDLKNNKIKLQTENNDFKSFNLNNLFSDLLKNNFKLIKDEHKERIKDIDYLSRIIFMNQLSNNNFKYERGYKYDYNTILNDILDYSIESIELIKQNEKLSQEEIELLNFKKEVYNDIKRNMKRMKSEVQLKCDN